MCAIPATAASSIPLALESPSIVVDYKKTVSEVLVDATTYMLQAHSIAEAFHFRQPCTQTLVDLPSWALDWQHDCCSEEDIRAIKLAVSRHSIPRMGRIFTWCPLSPSAKSGYITSKLDASLHLNAVNMHFITPADQRKWEVPRALSDGILEVPARVIDYVAALTDYTCDLEWLVSDDKDARDFYEMATLDCVPGRIGNCKRKRRFDPKSDHRRLAIMRTPADTHIALMPADTEIGDFLVAVAPEILPIMLGPHVRSPPRASEVYYDDSPDTSRFVSFLKGKHWSSGMAEYLNERRQRLEKVVEVFGSHFKMKGPALAMQGYDFYIETVSYLDFHELRVERNWLRPIQRFIVY